MFSTIGPFGLPSRKNVGLTTPRAPKGFIVRAFKGPTLSTHPINVAAKFDSGYRSTSSRESWHPSAPQGLSHEQAAFATPTPRLDNTSCVPSVERQPSVRRAHSSSHRNDPNPTANLRIFERSLSNPYGHFDCDPFPRHPYPSTPFAFPKPLTDSAESLIEAALSSPPLSVRPLVPPSPPHPLDARSHISTIGDGYQPAPVFDPITHAPFMGWSSLPPSARSDSDDDTLVEPEDRNGSKGGQMNGTDNFASPYYPDRTQNGTHAVPVPLFGSRDYEDERMTQPPHQALDDGTRRHVAYDPRERHMQQEALPLRRHTDPGPSQPGAAASIRPRRSSMSTPRCVRWNENLICPSPILPSQRRKGWFNRRGDQLWTNDGAYKPAQPGEEYPKDLDGYPEVGHGWMNEEGVRIDMGHHLIPKAPLRSALKKPKSPIS